MTDFNEAKIYVGTYRKYNEGSIFGKWFKLSDYDDAEELFDDAREFHNEEDDPEFMIQDCEGFPDHMYSESMYITDLQKVYDYFEALESVANKDAFEAYIDHMNITENFEGEVETFNDRYMGEFDSGADFAENFVDEYYSDANIPELIRYHIDFEGMWYSSLRYSYTFIDGYVFSD